MKKKLIRILYKVSRSLSMLPNLLFIGQCLYILALPSSEVHFESKGYDEAFLYIFALPALASVAGFIGSLIVHKRRKPGAIFMVIAGATVFMLGIPFFMFGYVKSYDAMMILTWVEKIPSVVLIITGAILVSSRPDAANPDTKAANPPAEPAQ